MDYVAQFFKEKPAFYFSKFFGKEKILPEYFKHEDKHSDKARNEGKPSKPFVFGSGVPRLSDDMRVFHLGQILLFLEGLSISRPRRNKLLNPFLDSFGFEVFRRGKKKLGFGFDGFFFGNGLDGFFDKDENVFPFLFLLDLCFGFFIYSLRRFEVFKFSLFGFYFGEILFVFFFDGQDFGVDFLFFVKKASEGIEEAENNGKHS